MNNILIYSDIHISQSSLKECILILEEIGMLAKKYNVDTLINLGDTFDGLKPSSSEMDIFATFIRRLGNDKQHIIVAANSHESTTQEESILNHYGILSNNVKIVKEFKDGNNFYCGHFNIKESCKNFGAKLSKVDLKNYLYVFLGHIHSYELIKPNIVHLGSCRYINFDEAKDKHKVVALIENYGTDKESVHFLGLKSPISVIQLELGKKESNLLENSSSETLSTSVSSETRSEAKSSSEQGKPMQNKLSISECQTLLDSLNAHTKVKVKILDFESFKQFLPLISKYSSKFEIFKYETCFDVVSDLGKNRAKTETTSFKESFRNWLKNQKIDPKITEILQKEVE